MPFGPKCEHASMESCVETMQGKVDDPGAYCAALMRRTEEHCKALEDAAVEMLGAQKQGDLAKICGGIWFNGSQSQREGFEGGTEGRGRDEKPPKAWWDDCMAKVSAGKALKAVLGVDEWIREKDVQALEDFKSGKRAAPIIYKAGGHVLPEAESKAQQVSERVFVASEESEDRMGDIIPVGAWDIERYMENPVYLYGHNHDILPVGISPRVWVDGKRLLNTVKFDERDDFAKQVKAKIEGGFLRAESVGFRPLEFEHRKDAHDGILFTKVELLEISIVPIPAHPAALALGYGAKQGDMSRLAGMLDQMQEMMGKLEGMMKTPGKGQKADEIHEAILRATRALSCC